MIKMEEATKECYSRVPWCKECGGAYTILFAVFAVIVIYFFLLRGLYDSKTVPKKDFMNRKLFNFPLLENCCSLWPLSHFILFAILGFLFPNCAIPLIGLGIMWEGFEVLCSKIAGNTKRQSVRSGGKVEYSGNWWAGSTKDIVMNIAGFTFGWTIAQIFASRGVKACINSLNGKTEWCEKKECRSCRQ